jgi:succinate-semialdehyde dehydrogenase / glutarate-semialdehyde dehydrogenase
MPLELKDTSLLEGCGFLGGEWTQSAKTFQVSNPATGEKIIDVADLTVRVQHQ